MRTHRWGHGVGALIALSIVATVVVGIGTPSGALADTTAYELYCPGTPVGNVVMNGVVTTGTMAPVKPKSGHTFSITGYQTTVPIPVALVSASAALGNKRLTGTATSIMDATGATPKSIRIAKTKFSVPIPKKIPKSGVVIAVPESPMAVGPFKATASKVTVSEDPHLTLKLVVSGSSINLACLAYPNNTFPTGITVKKPKGTSISPEIASS
jgi:hypothetical protein